MMKQFNPLDLTSKPLAAPGLLSYRCKGLFGWIMIGATDDADAMVQAKRSSTHAKREDLQKWDGNAYVPCQIQGENSNHRSIAGDPKLFVEELGYDICEDSLHPGLWVWSAPTDGCDSFPTSKAALDDAWEDVVAQTLSISDISREDFCQMDIDQQRVAITLALSGELPALTKLSPDTQVEWLERVRAVYPDIGSKEAFRLADQEYIENNGVLPITKSTPAERG